MKRTLYISILGKGWYGQTIAADHELKIGAGPFETDISDPTNADDVHQWLTTNTGDFASVTAVHAIYVETAVKNDATQFAANQVYREWTTCQREITVIDWDENAQIAYDECMFSESAY